MSSRVNCMVVETPTLGENVLVQKMLFARGYEWAAGERDLYSPRGGSLLLLYSEGENGRRDKVICYAGREQARRLSSTSVTPSDIASWPKEV